MESIQIQNFRFNHYINNAECYELVKQQAEKYTRLQTTLLRNQPSLVNLDFENDDNKSHTLGYLLKNQKFELGYTVIYEDDDPIIFGGIRIFNDTTTIISARAFCFFTPRPLIHKLLIPFHLKISKDNGFSKAITTFNDYNKKIYDSWPKLIRKKSYTDISLLGVDDSKFKMLGQMNINYVNQWVIEWQI